MQPPTPHLHGKEFISASLKLSYHLLLPTFLAIFPFKNISLLAPELDTPVFVILVLTTWIPSGGGSFCLFMCWVINFFSDLLGCWKLIFCAWLHWLLPPLPAAHSHHSGGSRQWRGPISFIFQPRNWKQNFIGGWRSLGWINFEYE